MSSFGSDLRYSFRGISKSPALATTAILTLGIAIGSVTTIYSALRALVLDPFSYPRGDRIVHVWSNDHQPLSPPDFLDIETRATSFAELGVYTPGAVNLGGDRPQALPAVSCTHGVLRAFGVRPAIGRWFEPSDEQKGAPPVAIISHRLWQEAFAGDPNIVGREIRLNGGSVLLVGIMPADFEFAGPWVRTVTIDVWMPQYVDPDPSKRSSHWLCGVARLKDGVSIAAADAEIKGIGVQLTSEHPDTNARKPFLVRSLEFEMTRNVRANVWLLFGAVTLMLLVACANVASMLLARSARRQGEFGVRIALGATGRRLMQLALAEALVLAFFGALLGIAIAAGALPLLRAIAPASEARRAAMALDANVLLFAIGMALLTALVAGLPPAFAAVRVPVAELLRMDSRTAVGSAARHRLLRLLIIVQIAVAFVLANGAALFSASYARLLAANAGLATDLVLSAEVNLRGTKYASREARTEFWRQLAENLGALPGVTAAGITSKLPLEGGSNMNILVNDEVFDPLAKRTLSEASAITPGYFAAVGLPLLQGRSLTPGDQGKDEIGVVVNRALAESCWPGKNPIGQIIRPSSPKISYHARVVGVVENVRQWGPDTEPKPEVYWTPDRAWNQTLYLVVRSSQPASSLASQIRKAVADLDPELPLTRVRTLQGVVDHATQGQRAVAGLIDVFMAVTLGLLGVGLYGTLSYYVQQRTREIGVRMALGAEKANILRLILRQGSTWVAVGVVLGSVGAVALAKTLRALVYGVDVVNPATLALATVAVGTAALLACWLPARRAAEVDPIVALRDE